MTGVTASGDCGMTGAIVTSVTCVLSGAATLSLAANSTQHRHTATATECSLLLHLNS